MSDYNTPNPRRAPISPELAQKVREAVARRKAEAEAAIVSLETEVETTFKMKAKSLLKRVRAVAGNQVVAMFCWGVLVGYMLSHI